MIFESITFNILASVQKDGTCYGNKFYLQCEDTEMEDHSFLNELVGRQFVITCVASELYEEKTNQKGAE